MDVTDDIGSCKIPTGDVKDWVLTIEECAKGIVPGEEPKYWSKSCISRVPDIIRRVKKEAFTPLAVSLGPFHNGAEALMPFEEYKRRALVTVLRRSGTPLSDFMDAVRGIAPELQDCYHNLEQKWRDDVDKFTQLMVLDGLFILEFARLHSERDKWNEMGTYATTDPVFGVPGVDYCWRYVQRDMRLLENQIPLRLIKVLLQVEGLGEADDKYINEIILRLFVATANTLDYVVGVGLALHPFDLLHKYVMLGTVNLGKGEDLKFHRVQSATELNEAGITFKEHEESIASIYFQKGVLKLHVMDITETFDIWYRNVLAFELIYPQYRSTDACEFFDFMGELVARPKDVELLERSGIIKDWRGNRQAVVDLFKELAGLSNVTGHLEVRLQLHNHCRKRMTACMASFRRTYFPSLSSSWASISLFGAVLVILLTASQTVYSVLQYHRPPGPG